jgi:hypothetical protein
MEKTIYCNLYFIKKGCIGWSGAFPCEKYPEARSFSCSENSKNVLCAESRGGWWEKDVWSWLAMGVSLTAAREVGISALGLEMIL